MLKATNHSCIRSIQRNKKKSSNLQKTLQETFGESRIKYLRTKEKKNCAITLPLALINNNIRDKSIINFNLCLLSYSLSSWLRY
uniref:Uncharacterized protein n=1 Tax=Octopus bimaculoides TaxID=37653 RepID=A0A0L8I663_OCTBM